MPHGVVTGIDFESEFDLPYIGAIKALLNKRPMSRERFDRLTLAARSKSFTIAWETRVGVISDVYAAAVKSVRAGTTFRDFLNELPDMMGRRGWQRDNPWHARVIFDQHVNMSRSASAFREMKTAGVKAWRYQTQEDELVCPICGPLNGRVYAMDDRRFFPPVHFRCRCQSLTVFDQEPETEPSKKLLDEVDKLDPDSEGGRAWRGMKAERAFRWDVGSYISDRGINVSTKRLSRRIVKKIETELGTEQDEVLRILEQLGVTL